MQDLINSLQLVELLAQLTVFRLDGFVLFLDLLDVGIACRALLMLSWHDLCGLCDTKLEYAFFLKPLVQRR
ncbi:hypothetical protein D3C85_1537130 [compost metagenome]